MHKTDVNISNKGNEAESTAAELSASRSSTAILAKYIEPARPVRLISGFLTKFEI